MTEKADVRAAVERAADNLIVIVTHDYEDTLLDVWAATWPGGENAWYADEAGGVAIEESVAEAHRERIFREVMLAMAAKCLERGRSDGPST